MNYLRFTRLLLYIIFFLYLSNVYSNQADSIMNIDRSISATAWNMNCLFDRGQPYLHELLKNSNIIILNEHGLYPKELYKLELIHKQFDAFGKASKDLKDANFGSNISGHCGCAIMWNKNLSKYAVPMPQLGTDRICVLHVVIPGVIDLYVIGVYLPYQGCKIASFTEELTVLEDLIVQFNATSTVLVLGDINAHIRINQYRSWGKNSLNGNLYYRAMCRNDMAITDLMAGTLGPNYSFNRNTSYSYVDHCTVQYLLILLAWSDTQKCWKIRY